jgi:hypothetical protein
MLAIVRARAQVVERENAAAEAKEVKVSSEAAYHKLTLPITELDLGATGMYVNFAKRDGKDS